MTSIVILVRPRIRPRSVIAQWSRPGPGYPRLSRPSPRAIHRGVRAYPQSRRFRCPRGGEPLSPASVSRPLPRKIAAGAARELWLNLPVRDTPGVEEEALALEMQVLRTCTLEALLDLPGGTLTGVSQSAGLFPARLCGGGNPISCAWAPEMRNGSRRRTRRHRSVPETGWTTGLAWGQPDEVDLALAARCQSLKGVRIRSAFSLRPRAVARRIRRADTSNGSTGISPDWTAACMIGVGPLHPDELWRGAGLLPPVLWTRWIWP